MESANHPDVAAAFQELLRVCQTRNIACGGTVNPSNAGLANGALSLPADCR